MKDILAFIAFVFFIALMVLIVYVKFISIDRDFKASEVRKRLQIIADTTLSNSDDWEPVISEDEDIGVDQWGTETRLLYVKCPDVAIVVVVSAGPNGVWGDQDDIAEVAFTSGREMGGSND